MSIIYPAYQDGYPLPDVETTVEPGVEWPFTKPPYSNPDVYSKAYHRTYDIYPKGYRSRMGNRTAWTNLVTYSEAFDNAAWTKTNLTVVADAVTAPDGNVTMDEVLETVTNGEHSAAQAATVAASACEAFVFAQGGLGRTFIRLAFTDSASTVFSAFFDVVGGNVGALSGGVVAKIVAMSGGQFQCVMQFTPAAGAGTLKINTSTDGATISYAGDTAKGVYLWGAQVAQGANAPYVSTTSTTRAVSAPDRELAINVNAASPDPLAYLADETPPNNVTSKRATLQRSFARIPRQQIIPTGFLFATPNFTPQSWSSGSMPPSGAYDLSTSYGVISVIDDANLPFATMNATQWGAIRGYYDVPMVATVTGGGSTPTSLTVSAGTYVAGDLIVGNIAGSFYAFTVSGVSGFNLTGSSIALCTVSNPEGSFFQAFTGASPQARKRTRSKVDSGQSYNLAAQTIEDYYLLGVSPGISTQSDIPNQGPYTLAGYLGAWAAGASQWFNVQSTQLVSWSGPILKRSYTQANLSGIT